MRNTPDARFQEAKSDYLGKLIVTPEIVAQKIKVMRDSKSPGDGWNSSKTTNGNSRTNQYTTSKSVQRVVKRGSAFY